MEAAQAYYATRQLLDWIQDALSALRANACADFQPALAQQLLWAINATNTLRAEIAMSEHLSMGGEPNPPCVTCRYADRTAS